MRKKKKKELYLKNTQDVKQHGAQYTIFPWCWGFTVLWRPSGCHPVVLPACLLREGPAALFFRQRCLGGVALPPIRGLGSVETSFLGFCSLGFSCCFGGSQQRKMSAPRSLPQGREVKVYSSLNPPEHTVSLSVSTAANCILPLALHAPSDPLSG